MSDTNRAIIGMPKKSEGGPKKSNKGRRAKHNRDVGKYMKQAMRTEGNKKRRVNREMKRQKKGWSIKHENNKQYKENHG